MSNQAHIAWRMGTAIALTLGLFFLLQIPNSFRALNTVAMLCSITVFQHGMMKQRLLLIWISGLMGMVIDALFREAPWFYLPAYMLLVYATMHLASRSRDAATMMLLVFGYSGSVPTSDLFAADPIIAGFQRTIGVTLGVLMAILSLHLFPVRNRAAIHQLNPVRFDRRDLLFLAVSGAVLLCVGAAVIKQYGTFVVMLGLAWALGLPTQSMAVNRLQLCGLALGNCTALVLLTIFSASSNNPAIYITLIATIIGIAAYIGASYPGLKPAQGLFSIGTLVPCTFDFHPLGNVTPIFPMLASMWIGILVSSLIFMIFRTLEGVEKSVLKIGT
jgi:hypothetical protein